MRRVVSIQFFIGLLLIAFSNLFCNSANKDSEESSYLNHHDTVSYVGKEACKNCHLGIYESFVQTGMGQSFGKATKAKSAANFTNHKPVYDSILNLYYYPKWIGDTLFVLEFRLRGRDTIHKRIERVDYIIGSGQHTNSHLTNLNGFIYQLPLTWYSQKKQWDLPPGFEKGRNVRFSRAIEMECMSCHNAMPEIAPGSENKFLKIPEGIDCERCHGPGELHVFEKAQGKIVDTATQIDYTIVNPKKLSWERQIDVCQRCHLQGNAVLQPGKSFADFRPGMNLGDYVQVFMPKFVGRDDEFIMASHAQRLQQSKCFIASNKANAKVNSKGFASMSLTCITCHNPHVSVKVTGKQIFNNACLKCHQTDACKEEPAQRNAVSDNCVSCHMPQSGSVDIPHVSVHDHKIKIPVKKERLSEIKQFAGIYCVNTNATNSITLAKANLNYVEKFEGDLSSLDSAKFWIQDIGDLAKQHALLIHYWYLKNAWSKIAELAKEFDLSIEQDAWLCYRIGQAYQNLGELMLAETAFKRAVKIAPENLALLNKLAVVKLQDQEYDKAIELFQLSLSKQSKQPEVLVNLGFALANSEQIGKALACYTDALKLDPDYQQALLNRAALFMLNKDNASAIRDLKQILVLNPNQIDVKQLLKSLQ
ncbi:MAG: tetratricopeptide repeat protein [bacterium]|nr:tetratricopeptide repeat protein [bacterium]